MITRALCSLSFLAIVSAQLNLNPELNRPANASNVIDPSFAGFGIESTNLFSFTGYETPNNLTFNLLGNLVDYTGEPPFIRIGGTTQDYIVFDPDMQLYTFINNPRSTGQGVKASDSLLIGPKFFEVVNRFPLGTPVVWGLNMAYEAADYRQRLVTMAKQVINGLFNVKLVSFEIGNEPDLFIEHRFRANDWTGIAYTQEWQDRAGLIWENILKPMNVPSNFFEAGVTASTIGGAIGSTFEISRLRGNGITDLANGSDVSFLGSWNQHDYYYFLGVSTYTLTLDQFIDFSTTDLQFAAWKAQVQQATNTGLGYALREMAPVGPIGLAGITDTFAGALWTLNFLFYAASLNITSVQMHMTDNSNTSAWQPIEMYGRKPFVRPNYYAHAAFAQIIGKTCQARVVSLDPGTLPARYVNRVRVYGVYQADDLASLVILNGALTNSTQSPKGNLTIQLNLPASLAGQTLYLSYMTGPGADATSSTSWNGMSYEQSGTGRSTAFGSTSASVGVGNDGIARLQVRDSEAIVIGIGTRVGTTVRNDEACAGVALRNPGIGPRQRDSSATQTRSNGTSSGSGQRSTAVKSAVACPLTITVAVSCLGVILLSLMQ